MNMSTVVTAPIEIDDKGVAWLTGTRIKVIEVALDHLAHGWSPEEIFFQHYGQLSMAQIHAALSFYYTHQSEFDAEIAKNSDEVGRLRAEAGESPGRKRLRDLGLLP
jgi:uncharacterized protein (DUF433 family)